MHVSAYFYQSGQPLINLSWINSRFATVDIGQRVEVEDILTIPAYRLQDRPRESTGDRSLATAPPHSTDTRQYAPFMVHGASPLVSNRIGGDERDGDNMQAAA